MQTFIVLFRAINAGIKLPIAQARACVAVAGFGNVRSYIASGNLLVDGAGSDAEVEARIEAAIRAAMGITVEAIGRDAAAWARLIEANPFPDAAHARMLHLCVSKRPLAAGAATALLPRTTAGERVAEAGGALWIDFAGEIAGSKLTSKVLDKAAGSTVTARNWNTVLKLAEMAA